MASIDIRSHKDRFAGQTGFLIASGPSIANEDLSCLRGKTVITINGATLLQEKFDLEPAYFCTTDARFLSGSETRGLGTNRVHPSSTRLVREIIRPFDDKAQAHRTIYLRTIAKNGFSDDIEAGFYFWCTSVSIGIQMAWYAGITRLALLGVDLMYSSSMPRFYAEQKIQPIDPFLSVQMANIIRAARFFEAAGREIVLCSEKSMLRPYLPYAKLSEVLQGQSWIEERPAIAV